MYNLLGQRNRQSSQKDAIAHRKILQRAAIRRLPEPSSSQSSMSSLTTKPPQLLHQNFSHIPVIQAWGGNLDLVKAPPSKNQQASKPKTSALVNVPTPEVKWVIFNSARTHYQDGWGQAVKITSDLQLTETIKVEEGNDFGDDSDKEEIFLGDKKVKNEVKGCNILYRRSWRGNTCTITVWHCGPTKKA
jgi:hypothetical protein